MGQKTVRFSDLSGEIITDEAPSRIVIHEHPDLVGGPVEIDVLGDEALAVEKAAVRVTVLDLYLPGDDEPRRVTVLADDFDKAATDAAMSELLAAARPARRASRAAASAPARGSAASFATLETAGRPHKGRITEAEQRFVREHFDAINERLAAEGLRPIDLDDPVHIERYDLGELAAKRSAASRPAAPASRTSAAA
ncbi:MAG TPA: hypothetical protein VGH88_01320 [Streptosporangiaceae bacterium]